MAEKNIFVYKLFVNKHFSFKFIFYVNTESSLKQVNSLIPINTLVNGGLAGSHFLDAVAGKERVTFQDGVQFIHKK